MILKRNMLRAVCAMLAALLASMIVLNIARSEQLTQAQTQISAVYQKAFYETCELTESVSANFRKLLVAGDDSRRQAILGEISRATQGASGNLALLPLGEETVSATIKFINQAEDFAETLSEKLAAGEGVSEADGETMRALSEKAAAFSVALNELLERYENGQAQFTAADFSETGGESLYPLTGTAAQYPVLLYDGPFSDGSRAGSFRMLEEMQTLSREAAAEKLKAFIQVDSIEDAGESRPEVDVWEFHVASGGMEISAGVTKRGGEVLYLLPERDQDEIRLSEKKLCDLARMFLISRGYGAMEMSYSSRYRGILTVNFAATQDGVVLYPDLIKVQLSMKDGSVIGFDAKSYLRNHVPRTLAAPQITREEALRRVEARLSPLSAKLCVIPENRAERLCWEVTAADANGEFLVYIDAATGVERELLQILSRENGTLVI